MHFSQNVQHLIKTNRVQMFEARRNKVDDKPKMHLQVIYVWFAVSSLCFTVHVKATV